jgi:hypothetical protein
MCKMLDLPLEAFESFQLHYVLRGVKKMCTRKYRENPRLPVTIWALAAFCEVLSESLGDCMVKAGLALGVYGLLRGGEFLAKTGNPCPLIRSDVSWYEDKVVLLLRRSKTDELRKGVNVTLWKNGSSTCPWKAVKEAWRRAPFPFPFAPLLQNRDGSSVGYARMQAAVKELAGKVGLNPASFSTHSLRMGGATSLALLGFPEHVIKEMGRWRSVCYQLYLRVSSTQSRAVSAALGSESQVVACANWFGGLSAQRAYVMGWDDLADVARFAMRPDGVLAARLSGR